MKKQLNKLAKSVFENRKMEYVEITPFVRSLKGSFRKSTNFDYKKLLVDELAKKYL